MAAPGSSSASSQLVRCSVELTGPAELALEVSGWGSNRGEAVKAAESAARYLAEMNRMIDAWPSVLFLGEAANAAQWAIGESVQADWLTAKGDDVYRIPG